MPESPATKVRPDSGIQTTIAIMLPVQAQQVVMPLYQQHSYNVGQIDFVPHITVLYPFVPYEQLSGAARALRTAFLSVAPFDITIAGYGVFDEVVYMPPTDPEPIRALLHRIQSVFPDYLPYGGVFGTEMTPHISVAYRDPDGDGKPPELPPYAPFTFRVDALHINYGIPQTTMPFVTYDVIPLGRRYR